jgi:hypothetical protein
MPEKPKPVVTHRKTAAHNPTAFSSGSTRFQLSTALFRKKTKPVIASKIETHNPELPKEFETQETQDDVRVANHNDQSNTNDDSSQTTSTTREKHMHPSLHALMETNKLVSLTGEVVFDRNKMVDEGGFSTVYKGTWGTKLVRIFSTYLSLFTQSIKVAVKVLKINQSLKMLNWEKTMDRVRRYCLDGMMSID